MSNYKWVLSDCGAIPYPIMLFDTTLYLLDGSTIATRVDRILNNGWGEASITEVLINTPQSPPLFLEIWWFSVAENTFYAGYFEFDHEKVEALLDGGCLNYNGDGIEPIDEMIIGAGPGGHFSVWISSAKNKLLIAQGQGEKIVLEWKEFKPYSDLTQEQFVHETMKRLGLPSIQPEKELAIEIDQWLSTKIEKYRYDINVVMESQLISYYIVYENAEKEFHSEDLANPIKFERRGVPGFMELKWEWLGVKYIGHVNFDQNEFLQTINGLSTKESLELQILVYNHEKRIELLLYTKNMYKQLLNPTTRIFK